MLPALRLPLLSTPGLGGGVSIIHGDGSAGPCEHCSCHLGDTGGFHNWDPAGSVIDEEDPPRGPVCLRDRILEESFEGSSRLRRLMSRGLT